MATTSGGARLIKWLPVSAISARKLPLNPSTLALVDHLRGGGSVQPIHIAWKDQKWVVQDGRHRLAAYKLLGREFILTRLGSVGGTQ